MKKEQNSGIVFLIVLLFIVVIAMAGYILWDKLGNAKTEINGGTNQSGLIDDKNQGNDNTEITGGDNQSDSGDDKKQENNNTETNGGTNQSGSGDGKSQENNNAETTKTNNVNVFKISSMKCLNHDSKFRLSGYEQYFYGLKVNFENNKFNLVLDSGSDLSETYPEAKKGVKVEINGLDTSKVADVFISHVGSDFRMPQVLFLMEDGSVYAIDSMKALSDGATTVEKLKDVQDVVGFLTVDTADTPRYATLAITANGYAYRIYGILSTSKIAIRSSDTLNVSLSKVLSGSYSIASEYFYGLSVKQEGTKFYLKLDKGSDLAKEYSDAKCDTSIEVKGIDGTRVSQVKIKHRGSDVRMPDVLFLMEDGTVYSVDCRQALTTGDSKAQKLEQITGVVTMRYAYMDNTPGQCVLGFKANGDYYLL